MPPNVLFICADDLGHVNRLMSLLVDDFDLPNLRRICNAGTEFDRAYCAVPVCEPARTAVMTGLSPADTKSFDLTVGWDNIVHPRNLWTYRLREAGYYMGTTGKVFHGYRAQPAAVYDVLYDTPPFVTGPFEPGGTEGVDFEMRGGLYGAVYYSNETSWYDVNRANDAINFINSRPVGRPWYYECGFHHPHTSWQSPMRIHDMVPLENVRIPESWETGFQILGFVAEFMPSGNLGYGTGINENPQLWTPEQRLHVRETIRNYCAGALWMDEQLGRVYDALMASPHADDTIVAFYSDHGYHLGDHGRYHKFTAYEQAAVAPMAIKVPGQTPRKVTSPVSHVDLGATILDLCGVSVPPTHMGASLKPWIDGATPPARAIPTFWYGSSSVAVGNKRVTVYQDGSSEMFNIDTDPWCRVNIAASDPGFDAVRTQALQAMLDWHMLLVEGGLDTSHASNLQSFLGTDVTDARFMTSFVAIGEMTSKGRSPGYQKMFGAPEIGAKPTVRMPAHVEDFSFMGYSNKPATLIANDLDNRLVLPADTYFKRVEMHMGAGDDWMGEPGTNRMTIYGGPGNDLLRAGTNGLNMLDGGTGDDTLVGAGNDDFLYGGPGNDSISGGGGNDRLYAGPGNDTLDGGSGDDRLHLDAGSNRATGGTGADLFIVARTGELNTITDFNIIDTLDLTDWAVLGPVTLTQVGATVEVTAGVEKLICLNTTVATISQRITGTNING